MSVTIYGDNEDARAKCEKCGSAKPYILCPAMNGQYMQESMFDELCEKCLLVLHNEPINANQGVFISNYFQRKINLSSFVRYTEYWENNDTGTSFCEFIGCKDKSITELIQFLNVLSRSRFYDYDFIENFVEDIFYKLSHKCKNKFGNYYQADLDCYD